MKIIKVFVFLCVFACGCTTGNYGNALSGNDNETLLIGEEEDSAGNVYAEDTRFTMQGIFNTDSTIYAPPIPEMPFSAATLEQIISNADSVVDLNHKQSKYFYHNSWFRIKQGESDLVVIDAEVIDPDLRLSNGISVGDPKSKIERLYHREIVRDTIWLIDESEMAIVGLYFISQSIERIIYYCSECDYN